MTDTNKVFLIGRLTRDLGADERSFGYIGNGTACANVSIAVNRAKKNGDTWSDVVHYFDVTIWGKQAENLKPYLLKGKQIHVEGHLQQERWEKDGQKHSRVAIVADNVQLLGGKSEGGAPADDDNPRGGRPRFEPAPAQDNGGDFPEDIPF